MLRMTDVAMIALAVGAAIGCGGDAELGRASEGGDGSSNLGGGKGETQGGDDSNLDAGAEGDERASLNTESDTAAHPDGSDVVAGSGGEVTSSSGGVAVGGGSTVVQPTGGRSAAPPAGDGSSGHTGEGAASVGGATGAPGGNANSGNSSGGGSSGDTNGGGSSGDTLPELLDGQDGFAARYWDCCKPSCAWTGNAGDAVDSCDIDDNNIGVDDMVGDACTGGTAFTCHSLAPWAVSDTLSYGFAAFNGPGCGGCYQIQFSGTSSRGTPTPGIEGKQMIVQVVDDVWLEQNEFDLLIPGGGTNDMNACVTQWKTSDLGAQYGGWRSTCGADAGCVRDACQAAFGDDPELMAGCDWYIDWLQMADMPDIRYARIGCPEALTAVSGSGSFKW